VVGAYGVGRGLYGEGMREKVEGFAAGVVGGEDWGEDFDVIHAHDWMTFVAGMAMKERTGKPLVAHVHSLEFDRSGPGVRGWVYDIEREGMERADVVVAVSGYTAGVCGREYGIGRGKIAVVHNGVEAGCVGGGPREELVVFVGRLAWQKGGEMFVRVAKRVRERFPGVRFVMAGDGELREQLVGRGVEVLGFLERDEVFALLARAKVFCMPSVSEPFGIAALEAAVAGLPVVVSRQSGVREVLGSARLVDGWDESGWVEQVCRLFESEGERRELGSVLRQEAQRCSWDGAAARILGVYREWLGVG
ncbi:MAG: glycosyltransferase family 4 protein, partial [Verrucomicrobiales bacterium]|nr:glycosyltransferase family 4 protein [Verrucomicrobiales bacterium]